VTCPPAHPVLGIDFTSAPRRAKPITIARGLASADRFELQALDTARDFAQFEAVLAAPGPWIAGIDAPLGLPREAVRDLALPAEWAALVTHCRDLGRDRFRALLDAYRESRPPGRRYAHRATDHPARSHSPLKLVNPPVGLMFLETAWRLLAAGVTVPPLHAGDHSRVVVEAYPGYAARQLDAASYKADDRARQTPARRTERERLVARIMQPGNPLGITLAGPPALLDALIDDPAGDTLDAALAAMQAAWSHARRHDHYGLPPDTDPVEGWIATVPRP